MKVVIERVVRETWSVDSSQTAQGITQHQMANDIFARMGGKRVKHSSRTISSEVVSQREEQVETAPWDYIEI